MTKTAPQPFYCASKFAWPRKLAASAATAKPASPQSRAPHTPLHRPSITIQRTPQAPNVQLLRLQPRPAPPLPTSSNGQPLQPRRFLQLQRRTPHARRPAARPSHPSKCARDFLRGPSLHRQHQQQSQDRAGNRPRTDARRELRRWSGPQRSCAQSGRGAQQTIPFRAHRRAKWLTGDAIYRRACSRTRQKAISPRSSRPRSARHGIRRCRPPRGRTGWRGTLTPWRS